MNVLELLAVGPRHAGTSGDRLALAGPDLGGGQRRLSYSELFATVERASGWLEHRGLRLGDRVAIDAGNCVEFAVATLAAFRMGAILLPLNPGYRAGEIRPLLRDSQPRLLLADAERLPLLSGLAAEVDPRPDVAPLADILCGDAPARPVPVADGGETIALLLYTSGTTGPSKGAMITHANLLATISALLAAWAWSSDDALLLTLPLFHVHGLVVGLLSALAAGAGVELRARFQPAATLDELGAGQTTVFFGVPTMYHRLVLELCERGKRMPGLDRLRLVCSGSAPLAPETFHALEELTGHVILERYGMTEAGMILSNPYAGPRVPGEVGLPLPGVSVLVVDDDGGCLAAGSEGELLVRGGNVFRGYWQAPEKTAAAWLVDDEGRRWFRTGDLARQDPARRTFTLLGRRGDLILCGGFNVYPREIEELLAGLPGVAEAAVIGAPDRDRGEVPIAFVVAASDREPDPAHLLDACRERLASFKTPREVRIVAALPRNALGKLQRHLLRAQIQS